MIGDIAVPVKSFDMSISFDQSFRHFTAPVAASNALEHGGRAEREDPAAGDERRRERALRHLVRRICSC